MYSIHLVKPSSKYKDSFLEALDEYKAENREYYVKLNKENLQNNFDSYISSLNNQTNGKNLPKGYVPHSTYWIIDQNNTFLGRLDIRHKLTENLILDGGHIGYDIRPSARNKGYATEALNLSKEKAKLLGLNKIILTCDEENIASQKVIEKNRGTLEKKYILPSGQKKRRYSM